MRGTPLPSLASLIQDSPLRGENEKKANRQYQRPPHQSAAPIDSPSRGEWSLLMTGDFSTRATLPYPAARIG